MRNGNISAQAEGRPFIGGDESAVMIRLGTERLESTDGLRNNVMNKILKAAFVAASIALPLQIQATSITILNAGFESPDTTSVTTPPTSWNVSGGGAGVWDINAFPAGFWSVGAPEGTQIAFISSAPHPGTAAALSQVLGDSLLANTIYTLSGYVGHPIGFDTSDGTPGGLPTIYTASLYAGGNLLGSTSGTGPSGTFTTFNLNFDSTGSAFVGLALEVRLESNQAQTGFDAISLQAQGVPDGGLTIMLLGMSMTGLVWMRRKVS